MTDVSELFDMTSFADYYPIFKQPMFIDAIKDTAYISGGSVLSGIRGNPYYGFMEDAQRPDIDIYLKLEDCDPIMTYLSNFPLGINATVCQVSPYDNSFFKRNHIVHHVTFRIKNKNDHSGSFYNVRDGYMIDIMLIDNSFTVEDVLSNFDLTCCQNWLRFLNFDDWSVHSTHPQDILNASCNLNIEYVPEYIKRNKFIVHRVKKYAERGFNITIPCGEYDTVVEADISQGYWTQIIKLPLSKMKEDCSQVVTYHGIPFTDDTNISEYVNECVQKYKFSFLQKIGNYLSFNKIMYNHLDYEKRFRRLNLIYSGRYVSYCIVEALGKIDIRNPHELDPNVPEITLPMFFGGEVRYNDTVVDSSHFERNRGNIQACLDYLKTKQDSIIDQYFRKQHDLRNGRWYWSDNFNEYTGIPPFLIDVIHSADNRYLLEVYKERIHLKNIYQSQLQISPGFNSTSGGIRRGRLINSDTDPSGFVRDVDGFHPGDNVGNKYPVSDPLAEWVGGQRVGPYNGRYNIRLVLNWTANFKQFGLYDFMLSYINNKKNKFCYWSELINVLNNPLNEVRRELEKDHENYDRWSAMWRDFYDLTPKLFESFNSFDIDYTGKLLDLLNGYYRKMTKVSILKEVESQMKQISPEHTIDINGQLPDTYNGGLICNHRKCDDNGCISIRNLLGDDDDDVVFIEPGVEGVQRIVMVTSKLELKQDIEKPVGSVLMFKCPPGFDGTQFTAHINNIDPDQAYVRLTTSNGDRFIHWSDAEYIIQSPNTQKIFQLKELFTIPRMITADLVIVESRTDKTIFGRDPNAVSGVHCAENMYRIHSMVVCKNPDIDTLIEEECYVEPETKQVTIEDLEEKYPGVSEIIGGQGNLQTRIRALMAFRRTTQFEGNDFTMAMQFTQTFQRPQSPSDTQVLVPARVNSEESNPFDVDESTDSEDFDPTLYDTQIPEDPM